MVYGFKFQVSGFRFQVPSFTFQFKSMSKSTSISTSQRIHSSQENDQLLTTNC